MQVFDVPLADIIDSAVNARSVAAVPDADVALMRSIQSVGLLEPGLVTDTILPDRFVLVAGRRRVAACRALGMATIPAISVSPPEDGDGSEEKAEAFYRA